MEIISEVDGRPELKVATIPKKNRKLHCCKCKAKYIIPESLRGSTRKELGWTCKRGHLYCPSCSAAMEEPNEPGPLVSEVTDVQ